ncbi:MAG: LD-carboxypeptidase [Calditrichaeota bacterium]|nr:LD-carboxypeptidase [Calditrichota bacterium]
MKSIQFPKPLNSGDLIQVVSPAGPVDETRLNKGIARLRNWGYRVRVAPHALSRCDYLAGSDSERSEDLINAFTDPDVKAIICSRGGYGSARILGDIPWRKLRELPPKYFIGFSDISAILLQLWSKSCWISLSGPQAGMALSGDMSKRSVDSLKSFLKGDYSNAAWSVEKITLNRIRGISAEGMVVPSCMSILVSLIGTPWMPNLEGAIVCLEDLNEAPYKIDRMLMQLRDSNVLYGISGIVLGHFRLDGENISKQVGGMVSDLFSEYDFGIWYGLPWGHVDDRITIPMGVNTSISEDGTFQYNISNQVRQ